LAALEAVLRARLAGLAGIASLSFPSVAGEALDARADRARDAGGLLGEAPSLVLRFGGMMGVEVLGKEQSEG